MRRIVCCRRGTDVNTVFEHRVATPSELCDWRQVPCKGLPTVLARNSSAPGRVRATIGATVPKPRILRFSLTKPNIVTPSCNTLPHSCTILAKLI